jgi:outer membrane protein OmpA-like peptidoglycan-associated protein
MRVLPDFAPVPFPLEKSMSKTLTAALGATLLLSACANMSERERGTSQGAAIGAVAGAIIGSATGGKAGQSAAIGAAVGAIGGNLWSKRMEDKRKAMEQATAGTGISVERTADNQLQVSVPSDLSFDVGSAALRPSLRPVLEQFASGLDGSMLVRVVGHTDSTGSDAINEPLSRERAETVRNFLADRGVAAQRISTAGRGAREPLADNGSETGRAKNRRVEIFLREPEQRAGG